MSARTKVGGFVTVLGLWIAGFRLAEIRRIADAVHDAALKAQR